MRKWLKYLKYTIICLVLALLVYCGHLDYNIFWFGDRHYMQIDRSYIFMSADCLRGASWPDIGRQPILFFDSVSEMNHKILTKDFSKDQMRYIKIWSYCNQMKYSDRTNGCLALWDLNSVYEPMYPSSFSGTKYRVFWIENNYTFEIKDSDSGRCLTNCRSLSTHEKTIDTLLNFKSWLEQKSYNIHAVITGADRNATEYIYNDGFREKKTIIYQIEGNITTHTVVEDYCLEGSYPYLDSIKLYGAIDGQGFQIDLQDVSQLPERPSVEWLAQFGIKKFEG